MSYFPTIPQPNDDPSISQSAIQTNFSTLNTAFSLNHVALGTGPQGKHNFVEMPNQGSTPATISGEGTLYTLSSSGSQLNYVADNNATDLYQLTRTNHANYALFGKSTNNYNGVGASFTGGWTFLPGGMLYQYGFVTSPGNSGTVTFPISYGSAPFSISLTFQRATGSSAHSFWIAPGGLSSTSFTYASDTSGSTTMYWIAIGV